MFRVVVMRDHEKALVSGEPFDIIHFYNILYIKAL